MLTFICALLLMFVMAGIISIIISFNNESPTEISDRGAILLSDSLSTGGLVSDHIPGGWTFVPNITPEIAEKTLLNANMADMNDDVSNWPSSDLLYHRPYVENITISDSWRGWFDYNGAADWQNAEKGINYQHFDILNTDCYCAAYIGHFECAKDIRSPATGLTGLPTYTVTAAAWNRSVREHR